MNAWAEPDAKISSPAAKLAAVEKEPMKRLSIDLPVSVHKELMLYFAANRTKATQVVRALIEQTIQKA